MKNKNGNINIIENTDGKMYLYDILRTKKETGKPLEQIQLHGRKTRFLIKIIHDYKGKVNHNSNFKFIEIIEFDRFMTESEDNGLHYGYNTVFL